ncbi:MAG: phosphoribosylanthranilate isomerase [Ardenticatenaceae bacterium]|nr:phosphoribosylanthranilate isomerase [Ardenticatenaceae bacterium]
MKVKICGITNLEDALVAAEAGADYLGFIFYPPSKRSITPEAAQEIVSHLRRLPTCPLLVGVFVDETADHMAHILDTCQLDLAQLSGSEVPYLVGDERSPIYGRAYKALRPTTLAEAEAEAEWYTPPLLHEGQPALLMDTYHPSLPGGTGETGDWYIGAQLAQTVPRFMLAGGLTAVNVATASQQVQPYAVDVASGVEARPGKKDPALVRAFIQKAKGMAAP